jgi:hypothetical protein
MNENQESKMTHDPEDVAAHRDDKGHIKSLSYGEMAVGIGFNPGGSPKVNSLKQMFAIVIDQMNSYRKETEDPEAIAQMTLAIRKAQESQMWAVKAVTW